ncbi:magnesium chelatase [Clostridium carboxidivorans P7]|uniref:Mg chelatase, subunit ChlI n=1 Tax=Clostridium carboxidivorans P7 TaxID=536227 RepID=C6PXR8_9CLOT|nr:YifB family Mg chelatase-like AAA ATPase [Clostridium carboxidivorans]AKN33464.1 magnesium chelatase [Clostridium carboxidivorans P7]EET85949.1 Mg chelatase, subunit ChlI [Clostridium carboxidivorans P7]EFG89154.1 Mg chelatase-like protein [Clostridium carboxidivorans P7]
MASIINSFAISGIDAYMVKIETDTIYGQPSVSIVGLGDTAIKEARERLEAAIVHSKYEFPKMKIVINLSPCDMKKRGSHFDLGMAVGLLIQSKQINVDELSTFGFIGELSLNADLRPCTGVLPMVIEAKKKGINNLIVPRENLREASLVNDINIFGFETLKEVVGFLEGTTDYSNVEDFKDEQVIRRNFLVDFQDVQGQNKAIEFIMIAAAGAHNILLSGSPGCGKSMIAKRIPTILPDMTEQEALEVTKIYSVAGLLKNKGRLITERPFRAPHHNASTNSLIGGGNNALPGEISLAHNGVLFLDEIAEFNKRTLDALRQPLEDNKVTISRVKFTNTYPANFMLVAAMNPCPCGYYGEDRCHCTDYEVLKYRQKISGPILDRIDIQKNVQPVEFMKLSSYERGTSSEEIREKVERARKVQINRFQNLEGVNCNAQMTPSMIREFCKLDKESSSLLEKAYDRFRYSARSFHKFLKVARTFADMDESENISKKHVAKALMCRELDKEQANMIVV